MARVKIRFGVGRECDVRIGYGLIGRAGEITRPLGFRRAFLIADRRLAKPARALCDSLTREGVEVVVATIEANEAAKDYRKLFPLFTRLIEGGMDRSSVLFALGGGVVGDLSGFVAASFLRGIRWVGVPTTLLAQVDSSVGGKTGVNHPLGKNLIGAFHQPSLVLCDLDVLATLDPRDRISGLGEIVKYGLAFDAPFFRTLARDWRRVARLEPAALERAVKRSLQWKARLVTKDEWERTGARRRLNFGHTLGHALEGVTHYRTFRHGEAVIVGMRLAAALSVERGHLPEKSYAPVARFLEALPVPEVPRLALSRWLSFTKRDKKAKEGRVSYVLLEAIGRTVIDDGIDETALRRAFARARLPLGRG